MRLIDRYLLREMAASFAASFSIFLLVSTSGVLADLLARIARGKVPAALLLSQLGLRVVDALPMLLPLALFVGVLLAVGRLYRDSEASVLAAAGLGPSTLLRPALVLILPVTLLVAALSMWLAPSALNLSKQMIDAANKSLLVAGLEPGRFVELPGRHAVVYLGEMSDDGSTFGRLFVHSERDGRIDVVTARSGELFVESIGEERYLRLEDGFRAEGVPGQSDYRVMRFQRNDIRVPDSEEDVSDREVERLTTTRLIAERSNESSAELHWRLAAPLATLALALLAVPLARSPPRAARYGGLLIALLSYLLYLFVLMIGRSWLSEGKLPLPLGLWWAHLPVFGMALLLLARSNRMPRPSGRLKANRA
ncbi:LPS export ABC transporter permease LptF [Pseudomarimonas arenosa]|uniref:Lipopolysaccharide export system permease protein LptF n=1 Tax=Pseudomarimonas arenosa TaxID=2774145 RepID=A0AAW3ZIT9_9GAMM|nr:LPS export ABC transporter permease LptF [Pseudomarimonas arenosa]MBD8525057.1 LPS export ABC transporter permease LptF [Pseudomarimonas arenosa]